jgi:FKBP-type peptidyl-prolyl cis-trans isomerase
MNLNLLTTFLLLALSLNAQKKLSYSVTPEGLKYAITLKNKKGKPVQKGDMVQVTYISRLNDTTEIARSENMNAPYEFVVGNGDVLKGMDLAVQKMKVGEKGTFVLSANLAYGAKKFGKVPENAEITMEISVVGTYSAFYNVDYNKLVKTKSGLEYVSIHKNANGEAVKKGNYVAIHYTGFIIEPNGKKKIFDSSRKNGAAALVQAGVNKFITGLDEGICLMNVGDSMSFVIPAKLGYGAKANQLVPANSTLGFDVYIQNQLDPFFDESKISYTEDKELGFEYCFVKDSVGPVAKLNENVFINVLGYYLLPDGSKYIFESSVENGQAQHFRLNRAVENPAWLKILQMCSVGDQVIMAIAPENARMELKKLIPQDVTVFFEFKLEAIEEPSFLKGESLKTLTTESGVVVNTIAEGLGALADTSTVAWIHYTGYTIDSAGVLHVFDSSFDRGKPFTVEPGKGQVIKGWDEALVTMKEGDQVRIEVPSEAGYGDAGMPPLIMPGERLYFDMYVTKVVKRELLKAMQNEIEKQ